MKLCEVGFQEDIIKSLQKHPLIRDNIKSMEFDFETVFAKMMVHEMGEEVTTDDAVKMKTDLFAAFCYGMQAATRIDSRFRQGFKLPFEFDPQKQIITKSNKIIVP